MRLLLTRPEADSRALAAELRAAGHECLLAPLLAVQFRPTPPPPGPAPQALLLTSANGARALAQLSAGAKPPAATPVYAVGEATARAAAEAGFRDVASAGGDVHALAGLVRTRLRPGSGPLWHVAGSRVAGDLAADLAADGYRVHRWRLYDAIPAERLPEPAARALREGRLDGVLLFSPRTAAAFVRLVHEQGLGAACHRLGAFCLSDAVAEAAAGPSWRCLRVAARPEQAAMLALLAAEDSG